MSFEIDLEKGVPDEDETPSQRRRRERRANSDSDSSSSRSSSGSSRSSDRNDTSLASHLGTAISKIADQMDARGDEELATALREERAPMSQGLVSLTSSVTPLRPPLVLALAITEPVLAFWRVGRILVMRFLTWRERRIVEAQEIAAWEAQQEVGISTDAAPVQ